LTGNPSDSARSAGCEFRRIDADVRQGGDRSRQWGGRRVDQLLPARGRGRGPGQAGTTGCTARSSSKGGSFDSKARGWASMAYQFASEGSSWAGMTWQHCRPSSSPHRPCVSAARHGGCVMPVDVLQQEMSERESKREREMPTNINIIDGCILLTPPEPAHLQPLGQARWAPAAMAA